MKDEFKSLPEFIDDKYSDVDIINFLFTNSKTSRRFPINTKEIAFSFGFDIIEKRFPKKSWLSIIEDKTEENECINSKRFILVNEELSTKDKNFVIGYSLLDYLIHAKRNFKYNKLIDVNTVVDDVKVFNLTMDLVIPNMDLLSEKLELDKFDYILCS